jgi:hypothetical protein
MTALELTAVLRQAIAADPFPMSPRVHQLRAILDKLEPSPARRVGRETEADATFNIC